MALSLIHNDGELEVVFDDVPVAHWGTSSNPARAFLVHLAEDGDHEVIEVFAQADLPEWLATTEPLGAPRHLPFDFRRVLDLGVVDGVAIHLRRAPEEPIDTFEETRGPSREACECYTPTCCSDCLGSGECFTAAHYRREVERAAELPAGTSWLLLVNEEEEEVGEESDEETQPW